METKIIQKCLKELNEIFGGAAISGRHDLTKIKIIISVAKSTAIRS
jgi:hypothetical protein